MSSTPSHAEQADQQHQPSAAEQPQQAAAPSTAGPAPGEPGFKPQIKASAAKRANSTVLSMVIAVLITAGIAAMIPMLSAQPKGPLNRPSVNVQQTAKEAAGVAGFNPLAPQVPKGWNVNYARWHDADGDGVGYWDVGYATAANKFIQLIQTKQANPTWLSSKTDKAAQTGTRTVDGQQFKLLDKRGTSTSLVGTVNGTTVIFRAELSDENNFGDVDSLATAAINSAK